MQLNNTYIIGVDGGGTKTRAVIGTENGDILAAVEGEGSNIKATPPEQVKQQITKLLTQLLQITGVEKAAISTIFLCMAGGDRQADILRWKEWMEEFFSSTNCSVHVTNDAVAALTSGTFAHEGLVIIAGTGSIVYCVQKADSVSRVGGWGYLFGDEGSGYYIGQEALRAVTQHYDTTGLDGNALTEAVLKHLKVREPRDIITAVYDHAQPRVCIASVAETVLELSEQGHNSARKIVQRATHSLVRLLETMFQKEPLSKQLPIVTVGGLFESAFFRKCFEEQLRHASIENLIIHPEVPPVVGAFVKGLLSGDKQMDGSLRQTVHQSWLRSNEN